MTPGVEVTTGPLGQGFANAVGMAIAERMLAARFNRPGLDIVDHRTFAFCGEGDMMEGISSEAASLAGRLHLGLGKLTVFFDSNHITLEGAADVEFAENVGERFDAYGWHVAEVSNVNALSELDQAIAAAVAETSRPSLVLVHSHIGYGSPVQDTAKAHGEPLGEENVAKTRETLGWSHPPFEIPDAVYAHWRSQVAERAATRARLAPALRALPGRPSGPGGRVRARDRGAAAAKDGATLCPASRPARVSPPASRAARRSTPSARRCRSWSAAPPTCSPRPTR